MITLAFWNKIYMAKYIKHFPLHPNHDCFMSLKRLFAITTLILGKFAVTTLSSPQLP